MYVLHLIFIYHIDPVRNAIVCDYSCARMYAPCKSHKSAMYNYKFNANYLNEEDEREALH